MKIVFYSIVLNNHQSNVADELWVLTGHQYCFVELRDMGGIHKKGDTRDYNECPYLLRAWESEKNWQKAMMLARTAECCVFSGVDALPFQKERMKLGMLSFDMSERWLKRGLKNVLSPAISKMFLAYWFGGLKNKPMYKLCCSAFAQPDHAKLGMYKGKSYKWGYFTKTNIEALSDVSTSDITPLMWCSRYLMWKHPELPIFLADSLKKNGYKFKLDMYGEGVYKDATIAMVKRLGLEDVVNFIGNKPNTELMADMKQHEIFLFTSDKNEGWGAVANESMSNGCVLVASDAIGSTPYLIQDGVNGFSFQSPSDKSNMEHPDKKALDSLYEKVIWLLEHKQEREQMRKNAVRIMKEIWSPKNAAESLIQLIDDLKNGKETSITEGPCSKA